MNTPSAPLGPSAGTAPLPAPVTPQAPSTAPQPPRNGSTLGAWVARLLWIAAGLGLLVGFFLPWFSLGQSAAMTGFGLLVTEGELVELVSGPHRLLLFAVPLLGVALIVSAARGHRLATFTALAAGLIVVAGGLYTVIRLFFSTTGVGMWLVVCSALLALAVSLLMLGRTQR